jgi:hypothetical protein
MKQYQFLRFRVQDLGIVALIEQVLNLRQYSRGPNFDPLKGCS